MRITLPSWRGYWEPNARRIYATFRILGEPVMHVTTGHNHWQWRDKSCTSLRPMSDATAIMQAALRLKDALREAYTDIAWNAYCTGHVDNDGMFDNCCMTDPEWLQGAITGSRKRSNSIPAEWLKAQIGDLFEAMVQAVEDGNDPYNDVLLERKP